MKEGLLAQLVKFCDLNDCNVEFNTETQCFEIRPNIKNLCDIFEV